MYKYTHTHNYIYIYIYIYIIELTAWYPSGRSYHTSLSFNDLVSPLNSIRCLKQSWFVLVYKSWPALIYLRIAAHQLSFSFLQFCQACFVRLTWINWEVRGRWLYRFMCNSHLGFSLSPMLVSSWCTLTTKRKYTAPVSVLLYQRDQISIWSTTLSMNSLCVCCHYFQLMRYCCWSIWTSLLISFNVGTSLSCLKKAWKMLYLNSRKGKYMVLLTSGILLRHVNLQEAFNHLRSLRLLVFLQDIFCFLSFLMWICFLY